MFCNLSWWGPRIICWYIKPVNTIHISDRNNRSWSYVHQLCILGSIDISFNPMNNRINDYISTTLRLGPIDISLTKAPINIPTVNIHKPSTPTHEATSLFRTGATNYDRVTRSTRFFATPPKNDGLRQWGWDDIPCINYGQFSEHLWNHQADIKTWLRNYNHWGKTIDKSTYDSHRWRFPVSLISCPSITGNIKNTERNHWSRGTTVDR